MRSTVNLLQIWAITIAEADNQSMRQIRVQQKKNIRVFMQWCKDKFRIGEDPSEVPFPVADAAMLLHRQKTYQSYTKRAENIMETAKPQHFTEKLKWDDWSPVFVNFLREISGRNGIPMSYVVRKNSVAVIVPGTDIIEDYINRAPLQGDVYDNDNREVHTYIVSFMAGNITAEAKSCLT